MADRAIVFVDGNNWYHSVRAIGATGLGRLDYARISTKLAQHREWIATRYYLGRVGQRGDRRLYSAQRRFLAGIARTDRRVTTHLGRLEPRRIQDRAARELQQYLGSLRVRIDEQVYRDLVALAARHRSAETIVEKAVDVMIAVDMVVMAERDRFDTAYAMRSSASTANGSGTATGLPLERAGPVCAQLPP